MANNGIKISDLPIANSVAIGDRLVLYRPNSGTSVRTINVSSLAANLAVNFSAMTSNIIPYTDNTYNLGNTTNRWASVHIGPGTIYIQDQSNSSLNAELTVINGVLQINGSNQLQVGQLKFVNNTIESTIGNVNIQIGLSGSSANLVFNRNVSMASGKTITYGDSTTQNTAYAPVTATFNPSFSTNTGNTLSVSSQSGSYTKIGKLCYFRAFVQFGNSTYADGSGQYQITLPFPSVATISIRGGTLHNTNTASIYHIGGIVDVAANSTVLPLYYTGSTTDLAWKNTTPVGWMTGNTTHFDISGVYETT